MTGWVELRALEKAYLERRHDAWDRARMVAHTVYINMPVFAKGVRKEVDARKWMRIPGDDKIEDEKPEVIHINDGQIKELNRIKNLIR